jgi:hypothetical protein
VKEQTGIIKILTVLLLVILASGCQEEFIVITEPDKTAVFSTSDTIAGLILKVTLQDGSFDDIIDQCSEISINFPYEIRIKNETITISSQEDIEQVEQNYQQFLNAIVLKFPVTVTFSDHSESTLTNRGDLQKIINEYEKKKREHIKCIDFIYPFDIFIYNTEFQKPESANIRNDKKLHGLLKHKNGILVEIDYPISVVLFDGTVLTLENNGDLETAIINAIGTCDNTDEEEFTEDPSNDQ